MSRATELEQSSDVALFYLKGEEESMRNKLICRDSSKAIDAKPFVKWAGGKGQLLPHYKIFFPRSFNNYIEPFVGGGAVFFYLFNNKRFVFDKEKTLIDFNPELINCYEVIKNKVEDLIATLGNGKYTNEKIVYYKIRAEKPKDAVERAARILYLNKTCYNGLYRVNGKGEFNVPFGGYKNPTICNLKNLRFVSKILKKVKLLCDDFEMCLNFGKDGDFIYLDPPYQPLSKTSAFTSYTFNSFSEKDQKRLSKVFIELDRKGCKVMLSNSDTPLIKKLYKNYRIETVYAKRAINSKSSGRGKIPELIVLNF